MERQYYYCDVCGMLLDEYGFYKTNNTKKYPNGRLSTCKKCVTLHVDNWKPETFLPILEEVDVPYIEDEWNSILERIYKSSAPIGPLTVMGKYLSKMHLKGFKMLRWSDTERIVKEVEERKAKYYGDR